MFQIHFPDHPVHYDNKAQAYSILYALLRSIVDVLNLEENDVSGCLQSILTGSGHGYSFILYDTTPGGAGHRMPIKATRVSEQIESAMGKGGSPL